MHQAAADMLAWEHSGFSIDASVRIALIDRDVPSHFKSLEHLLRYCARPPFALERLSVTRGADGQIRSHPLRAPQAQGRHLGRAGPLAPARGPPTDWGELVQTHDDRAIFQASPDELPAIDIHSR